MGGEIRKYCSVGINDACRERTVRTAKISVVATNTKFGSFASAPVENPLAKYLARLPGKIEEADPWSPTRQEVNTYIDCLEEELLQGCEYTPEQPDKEYERAASINDQPAISPTLFWGAVLIAVGCFCWLAKIILEAVD